MRPLTLLLTASTLVLALTSLYLYQQLSAARALAHSEQLRQHSLRGEVTRLEDVREELETDLRAARRAPSPQVASAPQPSTAAPLPAAAPAIQPSWRPPNYSREQRRLMTRYQYKRAFRESGLSESEIEAALDVLEQQADRNRKPLSKEQGMTGSAPDPQQEQAELAAVLGPQKAERFMAEKKLMPVRMQVNTLRSQLEEGGVPLSAEQQRTLLAKLAEKERPQFPRAVQGEAPQQSSTRFQSYMRDQDRELRDAAAPLLTPEQRKLMDEELKFREATRPPISFWSGPAAQPQAGAAAPPRTP